MNKKNSKERIQEIIKEMNDKVIPDLVANVDCLVRGGCGRFAAMFWDRLIKIGVTVAECRPLIYTYEYNGRPNETNRLLSEGNFEDEPWGHIIIKLDASSKEHYIIDGNGIKKIDETLKDGSKLTIDTTSETNWILGSVLSREELQQLIDNCGWNDAYDIHQDSQVQKILEEDLV